MKLQPKKIDESTLYFKALIYGAPGVGKTRWTAENVPTPVFIDFERSTDTLKKIGMDHIDVIHAKDIESVSEIRDFCFDVERSKFQTLVFDTVSSSQIFQLNKHMIDKYGKEDQKHLLPLFQDFRISTQTFNEIFFHLQHANINVVLLAHERENYQGEGEAKRLVSIGPSLTPALQDSTRQLVNAVLRLQKTTKGVGDRAITTRSMLCNSKGLYLAKNRYNVDETEIINPTWDTFMEEMNNGN